LVYGCVVLVGAALVALSGCVLFNRFPLAGFTIGPGTTGPVPFTVTLSGAPSSDPDGDDQIDEYSWDFGDGAQGNGKSVSHTYTAVGTYVITLTVIDKWGATDRASKTIYVTATEPAGPTASFTASPTSGTSPLTVTFDASASTYPGGTILSYEWSFGDGGTWTGRTATHTYFSAGSRTFTVTLTVRGTDAKSGTATKSITVTAPGGGGGTPTANAPSARFTIDESIGVAPFQVHFDPSESEADDGRAIILYTWSYGDGVAESDIGAGEKTHVYTTDKPSEIFTVTLLVLDNEGDSDSITKTVKVYNFRPVAGFEIANPPGGDIGNAGLTQFANAGQIAEADWSVEDVIVHGDLGEPAGLVKVWIRSKAIPDAAWFDLDGSLPQDELRTSKTSATSSTSPGEPAGYEDHNFCYDPEGQTWAGGAEPAWFPVTAEQGWGVRYVYIDWDDGSALERVNYDADGIALSHNYNFTASGQSHRITVTAEDYLGQESATFSRQVILKSGEEGANEE